MSPKDSQRSYSFDGSAAVAAIFRVYEVKIIGSSTDITCKFQEIFEWTNTWVTNVSGLGDFVGLLYWYT